jgi:transposase-like protein
MAKFRKSFTAKQKLEIIREIDENSENSLCSVGKKHGIDKSMVGRWKKQKNQLQGKIGISPNILKRKKLKNPKEPR